MSSNVSSIKLFAGILSVTLCSHVFGAFSGAGSGTQSDPYIITNVNQLQEMNDNLVAWYELGADIDTSDTRNWNAGAGFIPIGNRTGSYGAGSFRGRLNGQGYTITGLHIDRPERDYVGLFGSADDAGGGEIKDVGLANVNITGRDCVGGLIGQASYAGPFPSRCYTSGRVNGRDRVGGLIGYNEGNDLTDCYSTASVYGNSSVGGLVGINGGVSDYNWSDVTRCYSSGLVGGTGDFVGGLAGSSSRTRWRSCYWDVEASGQTESAGGLGKTTMEMRWQVTFSFTVDPWDFETVWNISEDEDSPFLRIFATGPQAPTPSEIIGSGTDQDPYVIRNTKELQAMNNHMVGAWYQLGNDIDASETDNWHGGAGFIPIGNRTGSYGAGSFRGRLNGQGYTITGLHIDRPERDYVGLFGSADDAGGGEIKDVGLANVNITGRDCVGGLIGQASYAGPFPSRCYTSGRVNGRDRVGGLIGYNEGNDLTDCYSTASVYGNSSVGGLVGINGGVSDYNWSDVTRCYSSGLVGGTGDFVGGLAGSSSRTRWRSCYWDVEASGQTESAGGLGRTTSEMKLQATFVDWDFATVWGIAENETYPFFGAVGSQEPGCPELPQHEPWSFVHMTDTHVGFPGARVLLARAIDAITQMDPKPCFVLVTGDVVDSAWFEIGSYTWARWAYKNYVEARMLLDDHIIARYEVPGNHDRYVYGFDIPSDWSDIDWSDFRFFYSQDLSQYCYWLVDADDYSFQHKGMLFIGMDSGEDIAEGNPSSGSYHRGTGLTNAQMDWLRSLDTCKPKIIFMHHPAVHNGDGWVIADNRNTQDGFIEYCKRNNVQLVLTGHTHQSHILDADGRDIAPGTAQYPQFIQTPSVSDPKAWFISDNPGYRIIDVVDNKCYPRPYSPTVSSPMLGVYLASHANVHVYDSSDEHVGVIGSGEAERGIPRSFYFSPIVTNDGIAVLPELIVIFDPSDEYRHEVIGSEEGTYRLNVTFEGQAETTSFETGEIPTLPGSKHVYSVNWAHLSAGEEGVIIKVDSDGDGTFERTITADSELTADEFLGVPGADAGPDQTVYAWFDCIAEVILDGSGSTDPDGDELTYKWTWAVDSEAREATGVSTTIELPIGQHTIELIVNDGRQDSEPDQVFMTVIRVTSIDIDIYPNRTPNPVYLSRNYTIYVAVLGHADLDVTLVDPSSVRFGLTGTEARPVRAPTLRDLNRDGFVDAMYGFQTFDCGFQMGDNEGWLTGFTANEIPVVGSDSVLVSP